MAFNKLKDEDLLKLVNSLETINPEIQSFTDVLLFISHFNITPGTSRIKTELMFGLYNKWSKEPIKYKAFLKEMRKHLRLRNECFYIHQSAMDISKAILETLKEKQEDIHTRSLIGYKKEVREFFDHYRIDVGETLVDTNTLLFLYKQFKPGKNIQEFKNACLLLIPNIKTKKGTFFKLSENVQEVLDASQKVQTETKP